MNYDIDTEEGMRNAVGWTNDLLSHVKDGGAFLIPRSGTSVHVHSKVDKICSVVPGLLPDKAIKRVLEAGGWRIVPLTAVK